jgi:hypothetical protein
MGPMQIPRMLVATAITAAVLTLGACTDMVGLAHGDPGRDAGTTAPQTAPPPPTLDSAAPTASTPAAQPGDTVSAVIVTFDDQMQQLAAADPRLSTDDIAIAVENELSAHHLYAPASAAVHRTLAITIANFSNSLASNATVLGYTFRNVALTGDVQIKGDSAVAGMPFDVHARARLTTRDAGSGSGSLSVLYQRFAVLTVAALRGVEAPSEPVPR